MQRDRWKMHLFTQKGYGQPQPEQHEPPLLFDPHADPGETCDVAGAHPDVVADMRAELGRHRASFVPAESQLEAAQ